MSPNTSSHKHKFHKALIYMIIFVNVELLLANKTYSTSESEMTYESTIKFKN